MAGKVQVHDTLTVGDLMRAAEMIAAVLDQLDSQTISDMQSGRGDPLDIGRKMITVGLQVAPEAGARFLAGLVDVTESEFQAMPADAVLDIAEQLSGRDDLMGFIERARELAGSFTTTPATEAAS